MNTFRNKRFLNSIFTGIVLIGTCTGFIFIITSLLRDEGISAVNLDRVALAPGTGITKINKRINDYYIEAKGIKNTGNICFASSVAQILFRIDSIRNFVLNTEKDEFRGIKRLFKSLSDERIKIVTDHGGEFMPSVFKLGEPGDSEEFYTNWIEKFEKHMPSDELQKDLFLKISLNRTNLNFNNSTISINSWPAIRINFPDGPKRTNPVDLETLLNHSTTGPFAEEERLTETLIQSHKIVSFPKFLSFIFVRTSFHQVKGLVKIKTPIIVPEYLNLSKYTTNQEILPNYKLKMFIIHQGDPSAGHYLSYIRDKMNDWKIINDEVVHNSSNSNAIEAVKMATICFYERVQQ